MLSGKPGGENYRRVEHRQGKDDRVSVHLDIAIGTSPGHDEIDPAFAEVWARNLPAIRGRVGTIEMAVGAARAGELNAELADRAREAAHKLAGSLGSFGLDRGSELARRLERRFESAGSLGDARESARLIAELRCVIEG